MSAKITTDMFIERARKIHGDSYDYSKVVYEKRNKKVTVICPKHGEFEKTPGNHLYGQGCPICSNEYKSKVKRKTKEEFVTLAHAVHGSKYDYSKLVYINIKKPVEIVCPAHGSFFQTPHVHLRSKVGCPQCAGNRTDMAKASKYRDKQWIEEQYVIKGKKISDIASELGVGTTTISKWLQRLGVETRSKKLTEEERELVRQRIKKYKAKYFQDNKERINNKRRANPIPKHKIRKYNFKYTYGITLEDYNRLLEEQDYKCAICGREHGETSVDRLQVDHCHNSQKVRGLLCFKCNIALGHFNDDITLVIKALEYLEENLDD